MNMVDIAKYLGSAKEHVQHIQFYDIDWEEGAGVHITARVPYREWYGARYRGPYH